MSAKYNEGLIERSYHALWEAHFANLVGSDYDTFVPGKEEVHVGYDLGFAKPKRNYKFTGDQFFDWMKNRIANTSHGDSAFLYAYFYQYKVIEKVALLSRIKSQTTMSGLISLGYPKHGSPFRAKLDTVRNTYNKGKAKRPFSQHEALCRLSKIKDTEVCYCTPKFDIASGIPKLPSRTLADLNTTRVDNKTPTFKDTNTHYLYFEDINGKNPAWCSNPVPAQIRGESPIPKLLSPTQLLKLMKLFSMDTEFKDVVDYDEIQIDERDLTLELFSQYLGALPSCTRIMGMWSKA